MKKITWETKPLYQGSVIKQHIAQCYGKDMCHMLDVYAGGIDHAGWRLNLPTKIMCFLSTYEYATLPKAKRRAEYIMRKMAEVFAPLVEVEK